MRKQSWAKALHAPRLDGAVSHVTGCMDLNGTPVHDGDDMRYRLDVVAASVLDVVEAAGGWLFDRRMAGWDVTVLVPEEEDAHALRILGVDIVQVGPTWTSWLERPQVHALAVSTSHNSSGAPGHIESLCG